MLLMFTTQGNQNKTKHKQRDNEEEKKSKMHNTHKKIAENITQQIFLCGSYAITLKSNYTSCKQFAVFLSPLEIGTAFFPFCTLLR